jgi:hypothetical protein
MQHSAESTLRYSAQRGVDKKFFGLNFKLICIVRNRSFFAQRGVEIPMFLLFYSP